MKVILLVALCHEQTEAIVYDLFNIDPTGNENEIFDCYIFTLTNPLWDGGMSTTLLIVEAVMSVCGMPTGA